MAVRKYEAATGKSRAKRAKAGAPLAKGVKGRTQALMNMEPRAREAAEAKTKVRATRTQKGTPHSNVVNRYNGVVTGSTRKTSKFTVKPKRVK